MTAAARPADENRESTVKVKKDEAIDALAKWVADQADFNLTPVITRVVNEMVNPEEETEKPWLSLPGLFWDSKRETPPKEPLLIHVFLPVIDAQLTFSLRACINDVMNDTAADGSWVEGAELVARALHVQAKKMDSVITRARKLKANQKQPHEFKPGQDDRCKSCGLKHGSLNPWLKDTGP